MSGPSFRTLPHNIEAERGLLGSIMLDNRRGYEAVRAFLRPEHFALLEHQRIYEACARMIEAGRTADPTTLHPYFANTDTLDSIGGVHALADIVESAVTVCNAKHYGEVIADCAYRRNLIAAVESMLDEAYAPSNGAAAEDIVARTRTRLEALNGTQSTRGATQMTADAIAPETIPARPWLYGTWLIRGEVTILAGRAGLGKTAVNVAAALSLASGRKLLGIAPHGSARRVLLLHLEETEDEMRRRIAACVRHHHLDPSCVEAIYCREWWPGAVVARWEDDEMVPTAGWYECREMIRDLHIDVVIVDPLVATFTGSENSNDVQDGAARLWKRMADYCNCAIMLTQHYRKGPTVAGDVDMIRGGGALVGAARVALTLTGMSEDEARAFGIAAEHRKQFARVDSGKQNMAVGEAERWIELIKRDLGNSAEGYPNGDSVQVAQIYNPPDTWEGLDTMRLNAILDDIKRGLPSGERYSGANRAGDRHAWHAVQAVAPSKTESQCRSIIKEWMRTGLLYDGDYHSPNQRRECRGLYVDDSKRPGSAL